MDIIPIYKLISKHRSSIYNSGKWTDGIKAKELTVKLQEYLDVKHVILTNSGTSALLAAYWVLKKKFNQLTADPYTFPATYQPARLLNYKVNFTRMIPAGKQSAFKVGNNFDLVVITHLFGQPNGLLDTFKNKKNFIEDACQAFGAKYNGKFLGTLGKIGCFSFYPTKALHSCGHAGAVVTNNEAYYQQMKVFIESGRLNGKMTENTALNLRIDEIKAEFLLYELADYNERISIQRSIAKEFIKLIPGHQPFLKEKSNCYHIYSTFSLLVHNRKKFRRYMDKLKIQTMVYYGDEILPKSQKKTYQDLTSSIVAIPCRWNLKSGEIRRIKDALKNWFI